MKLSIDTKEVKKFQHTLKALHRSAFPIAIRTALNSVAYHVKQETMPESAKDNFVNRRANFFKANSRVEQAKGFEIKTMASIVGFKPTGKANQAVQDLVQQEHGGKIGGRAFITTKKARAGNNWNKNVRANLRLSEIRKSKMINVAKGKGSRKQRFVRAAFMAVKKHGNNAFVLGNRWGNGNQTLSRIDEIWGSTRGSGLRSSRRLWIKRTPIYTYRKNRKITVARKNFMKRAALESGLTLNRHFQNAAINQIKKYTK